jgi:hypothetical protein
MEEVRIMKATVSPFDVPAIASAVLGIFIAYIVMAATANNRPSFITSDRAAFFSVFVLGIAMCAVAGIGRVQATLGWVHPITIAGIVLGILALGLAVAVFTGRAGFLNSAAVVFGAGATPVASGERAALVALAGIIFAKWALGFGKYILR